MRGSAQIKGDSIDALLVRWLTPLRNRWTPVYLVGGSVRDRLIGRPAKDIDLVCCDAEAASKIIARENNGVVVPFEKKASEPCFRVVDRGDPDNFIDLSPIGESIRENLGKRDFTINAIGIEIDPAGGIGPVIDPYGGTRDLELRLIRATNPDVFEADPLRILRAFRFSAELEFEIDPGSLALLKKSIRRIETVAMERVAKELIQTLSTPRGASAMREMDRNGILASIFPEITPMKGEGVWEHSLAVLENSESILNDLKSHIGTSHGDVRENIETGERAPLLKLAALLHDVGKPEVNSPPGAVSYGHSEKGAEILDSIARRLRMSGKNRAYLCGLVREHSRVFDLPDPGVKRSDRMRWFRKMGEDAIPSILLGMADAKEALWSDARFEKKKDFLVWSREAIADYSRTVRAELDRGDFIDGKDLLSLGFTPGPDIGKILETVRDAFYNGTVLSREDALRWVRENFLKALDNG